MQSFFKSISNFFRFGPEEIIEDDENIEINKDNVDQDNISVSAPSSLEIDSTKVDTIFSGIINIFNEALPDFLAKSVDMDRQRQLLYSALDQDVKNYLHSLQEEAQRQCKVQWSIEKSKMLEEAEDLKKKTDDLEAKKSEIQEKQLSAERQKRAMAERLRDMEMQIDRLNADKEQLELENKAMANRIKVANLLETENNGSELSQSACNEIMSLKESLESVRKEKDDLQSLYAEMSVKIEEFQPQILSLKEALSQRELEIDSLKKEIFEKSAALDQAVSEEDLQKLVVEIDRFEKVREQMDSEISRLKEALKKANEENQSLRKNLKNTLQQQNDLRLQLAQAQQSNMSSTDNEIIYESKNKRRKVKEDLSAQDEEVDSSSLASDVNSLLEGANWLVATPPKETSMRSSDDDDSFGYQPPQRKARQSNNNSQKSLFDF